MIALGGKPPSDDDEIDESSDADEEEYDSDVDEAIKTVLDPEADIETRIAAFRAAVKGC